MSGLDVALMARAMLNAQSEERAFEDRSKEKRKDSEGGKEAFVPQGACGVCTSFKGHLSDTSARLVRLKQAQHLIGKDAER